MNRINQDEEKEWSSLIVNMTTNQDFWTRSKEDHSRIGFQRFGVQLRQEDFEQTGTTYRSFLIRDRSTARKNNSGFSVVKNGDEDFYVELDVWPFECDELMVMVVPGLYIMIDGEHPEKCEDNSTCTRKFTRRYLLPKGYVSETIKASYCNGTLTIKADKNKLVEEPRIPRLVEIIPERKDNLVENSLEMLQDGVEVTLTEEDSASCDKAADNISKLSQEAVIAKGNLDAATQVGKIVLREFSDAMTPVTEMENGKRNSNAMTPVTEMENGKRNSNAMTPVTEMEKGHKISVNQTELLKSDTNK